MLAESVRQYAGRVAGRACCEQAGAERAQVAEACIVGNTAMTHLLLGYPVLQLAKAPYVAAASDALDLPAECAGAGNGARGRCPHPALHRRFRRG